jgi:hypothetical protein
MCGAIYKMSLHVITFTGTYQQNNCNFSNSSQKNGWYLITAHKLKHVWCGYIVGGIWVPVYGTHTIVHSSHVCHCCNKIQRARPLHCTTSALYLYNKPSCEKAEKCLEHFGSGWGGNAHTVSQQRHSHTYLQLYICWTWPIYSSHLTRRQVCQQSHSCEAQASCQ